jgi:hypothetical protein
MPVARACTRSLAGLLWLSACVHSLTPEQESIVAAKFEPQVPPEAELKRRAALSWVKSLAKALVAAPPEALDVSDARGCAACGLS